MSKTINISDFALSVQILPRIRLKYLALDHLSLTCEFLNIHTHELPLLEYHFCL